MQSKLPKEQLQEVFLPEVLPNSSGSQSEFPEVQLNSNPSHIINQIANDSTIDEMQNIAQQLWSSISPDGNLSNKIAVEFYHDSGLSKLRKFRRLYIIKYMKEKNSAISAGDPTFCSIENLIKIFIKIELLLEDEEEEEESKIEDSEFRLELKKDEEEDEEEEEEEEEEDEEEDM